MTHTKQFSHSQHWLIINLFSVVFIMGADSFIISPLLPVIAHGFQTTITQTALAISIYALCYAVGAPIFGPLSNRFSQSMLLRLGTGIFLIGSLLCAVAPNLWLFDIARAIAGLGAALALPNVWAIIGLTFKDQQLNQVMGIVMAALSLSIALGVPIGSWVAQVANWQMVFWLSAVFTLIVNFYLFKVLPKTVPAASHHTNSWPAILSVSPILLVTFVWMFGFYTVYSFLGTALNQLFKLSTGQAGLVFIAYGLSNFVASFWSGTVTTRLGTTRSLRLNGMLSGLLILLIAVRRASLSQLTLILILLAFTQGFGVTALSTHLLKSTPNNQTTIMALNNTCLYLGLTFSSLIGGQFYPRIGFAGLSMYAAIALFLATILSFRWHSKTI